MKIFEANNNYFYLFFRYLSKKLVYLANMQTKCRAWFWIFYMTFLPKTRSTMQNLYAASTNLELKLLLSQEIKPRNYSRKNENPTNLVPTDEYEYECTCPQMKVFLSKWNKFNLSYKLCILLYFGKRWNHATFMLKWQYCTLGLLKGVHPIIFVLNIFSNSYQFSIDS